MTVLLFTLFDFVSRLVSANLVQEFVNRLADALQPVDLRHRLAALFVV